MVNVQCLTLGAYSTNTYIVYRSDRMDCVIIDPGYQAGAICDAARKLGRNIAGILLTHGHFDHVGAVRELAMDFDCPVYISRVEETMPPQMTAGPLYYTNDYDQQVELAGMVFKVMKTPGHTPGSVCLLTEELLFSGDTLFAGGWGRTDLPGGDSKALGASLQRLGALTQDYRVLPGHGMPTLLSAEKQYNPGFWKGTL